MDLPGGQWAASQPSGASYSHRTQAMAQQALTLRPQQSSYPQPSGPAFGAGPSMGGYRPSRPAYDQTQMMNQRAQAIEHINQLTRAQSRGHRQEQCGTTSFWEELENSWREGTLVHDLGRVGLHELKTNPFWRQRITPKDIWQFARDLDRRVNDWFNGQANHCAVPGCTSTTVTTTIPLTVTARDTNANAENGLHVYAFDGSTYTGYNKTTNASGEATFTLPQGDYHFRADKNSTQFWSGTENHCTVPGCTSAVITTTIPLTVMVEDTNGDPEEGLHVYAFDGVSYTGYNKTTGADGQAVFTLPQGDYRFRSDKNGTQFWSGESNHCTLPGCTTATVTTTIPVVVTVEDAGGDPEPNLPVYAFDETTYTGYHGTTDVSGTVTLTLPAGDYRFRADESGEQYWSGASNHCTVPGCTEAAITVGSQAIKIPTGGLAFTLDGIPAFADVETLFDPPDADENQTAYRPPGLAALPLVPSDSPTIQSGETVTITRVITQVYDPLSRLTEATYSTGESFAYQYDRASNRTAYTSTTPISGTVVTTYTFDAANRLTDRAVSDGRVYTYTWSARGQMLAEYTQGYPVRTFTYDGAGRMVEATVFTLTTRFTYNGLGARVAVEVVGQGTTTYALDYAAGNRILAEETDTGTTLYLYGRDCLGELGDDEWLYYLNDGTGLVRQGVDEQGQVVSTWLFDPDGTVLEGPEGPVSHLVCGGVYDWSTGLIYKGGRYFDPMLGIWLALVPLIVIQSWRGRKKKRRGFPWYILVLLAVGVGGTLTACGGECKGPSLTPTVCTEITPFGQPLGDNAVFVGPTAGHSLPEYPPAITWTTTDIQVVEPVLTTVIDDKFGGSKGFGSLNAALTEFGVSTDNPIVLVRRVEDPANPGSGSPAAACKPYVYVHDAFFTCSQDWQHATLGHEMAHYWDGEHGWGLQNEMREWINWGDTATDYRPNVAKEDFAEAVKVYFWNQYDQGREWTDDMETGLALSNDPQYGVGGRDGLRLAPDYESFPLNSLRRLSGVGTKRVKDRYDYLEWKFTGSWY